MTPLTAPNLQARYERLLARAMRMGHWLAGPHGQALPETEWDAHFTRYQADLETLRLLGAALRPASLREYVPLDGDRMVQEVRELFAD